MLARCLTLDWREEVLCEEGHPRCGRAAGEVQGPLRVRGARLALEVDGEGLRALLQGVWACVGQTHG